MEELFLGIKSDWFGSNVFPRVFGDGGKDLQRQIDIRFENGKSFIFIQLLPSNQVSILLMINCL